MAVGRSRWAIASPTPALFSALVFLSLATSGFAQQTAPTISREQRVEKVAPGDSVIVLNPTGDIRARYTEDPQKMELYAYIQKVDSMVPPTFDLQRNGARLTITVHTASGSKDRVDLVLYLPKAVSLQAHSTNGLIEMKGLKSDVSADTETGEITIRSVEGQINTRNSAGQTSIELADNAVQHGEFRAETGDISIYVWEGTDAQFQLETSGEISTDFSLNINFNRSSEPDKMATAKLGTGRIEIQAFSKRGRIRLLRLLKSLPKADGSITN